MSSTDLEFAECIKRIVNGNNPADSWSNLDELDNVYDSNMNYCVQLQHVLTSKPIRNIGEIPRLLEWFSKFPFPTPASKPISDDIAIFLTQHAECFAEQPVLVDILQVLSDNEEKYLPAHNSHLNLCKAIVEVLAWIQIPNKPKEIRQYEEDLEKILKFLKYMRRRNVPSDNQEVIPSSCFKKLYEILLRDNPDLMPSIEYPSAALVIVLQFVDDKLWQDYMDIGVKAIFHNCKDENKINKMLTVFCHWLLRPPDSNFKYLSIWLSYFIQALDKCEKARISKEVAWTVLPRLTSYLEREEFYQIVVNQNVIFILLLKVYSLDLYHRVIKELNSFLRRTSKRDNDKVLLNFIQAVQALCINRFKDHNYANCPNCEILRHNGYQSISSYIPEESEDMEVSYPSTSTGKGRLDTGKVGLQNLGNTCYMNSVLQALVMTRKFCHEVLMYKASNVLNGQIVLKNLQDLFALLKYSTRQSLAPKAILRTSRPAYFTPGQQQDSSEFLCYLLDVLYEQEKSSTLVQNCNNDQTNSKIKEEDKEMAVVEEITESSHSLLNDEGTSPTMTRWTTEEDLCEGATLQRKTQSLADFTQGEDLVQSQNGLSDSHSDSTDSGIQSVGGEDTSSSATFTNPSPPASSSSYLVHRVFGGELKVIYQCAHCSTESHNTDQFRDLQLCFLDDLAPTDTVTVQNLIDVNYLSPEKLTGENKYRCDKCRGLRDAERIIKIVQAPEHLILTLKHFRYDSESRLRTKLRRKVIYDDTIQLPILDQDNETYQLYAAVVHSGYSLDYGHYITYACDSKNVWYKFDDSFVMPTYLKDFKKLEPPDTPYILFYKRCTSENDQEDAPDFKSLPTNLQEFIENDRQRYEEERKNDRLPLSGHGKSRSNSNNSWDRDNNDDDNDNPPSNCRGPLSIAQPPCLF